MAVTMRANAMDIATVSATKGNRLFLRSCSKVVMPVVVLSGLTMKITDRRWRRALAANPAFKEFGAPELKRLAAVRVHQLVRHRYTHSSLR